VRLALPASADGTDLPARAEEAVRAARERLRDAPGGGIGWPLLRHLNPQTAAALAPLPGAEVLLRSGGTPVRPYRLDVDVRDDGGTVTAVFTTMPGAPGGPLTQADPDALAEPGRAAAEAAARSDAAGGPGGPAAADLRHVRLDQAQADAVASAVAVTVEDIWPLSPLQRGLYFQSVFDDSADIYTAQFSLDFGHRVDAGRLRRALAALMD